MRTRPAVQSLNTSQHFHTKPIGWHARGVLSRRPPNRKSFGCINRNLHFISVPAQDRQKPNVFLINRFNLELSIFISAVLLMRGPFEASDGKFATNKSFTVQQLAGGRWLEGRTALNCLHTPSPWLYCTLEELHRDAFQMCLNNRGIELPQKWALEVKGSNLLSHRSLQTIIFFLLDRVDFSLSFFIFPSLYSVFSLFPSVHFWSRGFRFSHTLPCHIGRPQKCRTEQSVRGLWNSTCRG